MYEYIIDIPIGGELKKHIIELAKISSEYDNIYSEIYNNYKNKKNVVHITLKYWFIVENEKTKLFDELKELTNKQKTFNVKINNIKTFNNSNQFVIFADVNRYKTGDQYIKISIDIPQNISKDLKNKILDLQQSIGDEIKFKKISD